MSALIKTITGTTRSMTAIILSAHPDRNPSMLTVFTAASAIKDSSGITRSNHAMLTSTADPMRLLLWLEITGIVFADQTAMVREKTASPFQNVPIMPNSTMSLKSANASTLENT